MKFFKEILDGDNKSVFITANIIIAVVIVLIFSLVLHNKNVQSENLSKEAEHYSDVAESKAKDEINKEENDSFYQKLKDGYDVEILIVGDSIGKGVGARDESSMWFNILKKQLEKKYSLKVGITNISMSGTTSYAGYVRTMLLDYDKFEKGKPYKQYDLAIICYGQNDAEYGLSTNYESIIRAVMKKYPDASILSILESSIAPKSTKLDVIRDLCNHYEIPVVDTIEAFDGRNLSIDGVHPNKDGQLIYSKTVSKVIDSNVSSNTGKLKKRTAVNEQAEKYDDFDWYGLDNKKVRQTSAKSYTADISASGVLGVYSSYIDSGTNIYIDGVPLDLQNVNIYPGLAQNNIFIINPNCLIKNEITIEFENSEKADSFKGFCLSTK